MTLEMERNALWISHWSEIVDG